MGGLYHTCPPYSSHLVRKLGYGRSLPHMFTPSSEEVGGLAGLPVPLSLGLAGLTAPLSLGLAGLTAPLSLGLAGLTAPLSLGLAGLTAPLSLDSEKQAWSTINFCVGDPFVGVGGGGGGGGVEYNI